MRNFENFWTPRTPPPPLRAILIIWLKKSVLRKKTLNSSNLKPVTPKNTQKYIINVYFPVEHVTAVSLPLLVHENAGNSKNWKIENPL